MKKINILIAIPLIVFAGDFEPKNNPEKICEKYHGEWKLNDNNSAFICTVDNDEIRKSIGQRQLQEIARQEQIHLQNERSQQRDQLLKTGNYAKAYQLGLIDKSTARTEMLKHYQIVEAYEAKLIDKDTADLYLQKQAMDNATRASQQQAAAIKAASDETNRQNDIRAMDAQSNQFLQQQIQNSNKYNKYMR